MNEFYSEIPYLNKATNKWEIVVLDQKGKHLYNKECESKEQAETLITENNKLVKKDLNDKANKTKLDHEKSTLENMLNTNEFNENNANNLPLDQDADLAIKLEEFKVQFEKDEEEVNKQAKDLLLSIAKLYFDKKIIDSNEYIKHKMTIEAKGVASTLFQLKTARMAIYKLTEEIYTGNTSPRMFEVLTGLQRIVLDISKFQHEYLGSLAESMKTIRNDIALNEENNQSGDTPQVTGGDEVKLIGDGSTVISTNSRKVLLSELNNMIEESKNKIKIPKSRNIRLHDNDENVIDTEHTEYKDENGTDEGEIGNNIGGLSSFEDKDDGSEDI